MSKIKGSLMDLLQEDLAKAYDIFVDMDGVLTNFEGRFEQFAGVTPDEFMSQKTIQVGEKKANEKFWDLVDKQIGVRFWAGMPWMPEGEELYKHIKRYKPTILTSPSREESSRIGKGVWVKRNMSGIPVKFGYGASGKAKFAGPNKILIDDRENNISAWKQAGGIGILFKSTEQVKNELSKLGL
jgi:hypothetical protein